MEFTILIYQDDESGMYLVDVPDLPGVITEGRTPEEAERHAGAAIRAHLAFLSATGSATPTPRRYEPRRVMA